MASQGPSVEPYVLTSWKEIAQYMGKGVRTVQRWEQRHGLPVRRPIGADRKGTVLARRSDLDAWLSSGWVAKSARDGSQVNGSTQPIFSTLSVLSERLRTAEALRNANQELLEQFRQALSQLTQTCSRLRRREWEGTAPISAASKNSFDQSSQAACNRDPKRIT